jgi:hypothetical protein
MSSQNYFIKVRGCTNTEPDYWSRQVLPGISNLYYNAGNVGIGGITLPYNTLSVGLGGVGIGTSYYQSTAPVGGLICSGSVGIGTNSPSEKLEVVGKIKATEFVGGFATLSISSSLSADKLGVGTSAPQAKCHILTTAAEDCLRVEDDTSPDSTRFLIDMNGNVGVGTSSVTQGKLQVAGNAYASAFLAPSQIANVQTYSLATGSPISVSGTMPIATSVTVTITPKSASSSVRVTLFASNVTSGANGKIYLYRGTSQLPIATPTTWAELGPMNLTKAPVMLTWIDTPASTSATTYTVYISGTGGGGTGTMFLNYSTGTGLITFTAEEIFA